MSQGNGYAARFLSPSSEDGDDGDQYTTSTKYYYNHTTIAKLPLKTACESDQNEEQQPCAESSSMHLMKNL